MMVNNKKNLLILFVSQRIVLLILLILLVIPRNLFYINLVFESIFVVNKNLKSKIII